MLPGDGGGFPELKQGRQNVHSRLAFLFAPTRDRTKVQTIPSTHQTRHYYTEATMPIALPGVSDILW